MKKFLTVVSLTLLLTICAAAAGAASNITGLTATAIDSTSLSVVWTEKNPGEYLYTVTSQAEGTARSTQRNTYKTYGTINYLVPGTTYQITVGTQDGNTVSATAATATPGPYTDFYYRLLDTGVYRSPAYEETYAATGPLNGAALSGELGGYDYSVLLKFTLGATKLNKYLDLQLVLRMPNGDAYTQPEVLWLSNSQTAVTVYIPFNATLKKIVKDYGAFPAGQYTLEVYIDGDFAAETTFTVE